MNNKKIVVITREDLEAQRISGFDLEAELKNPRDAVDPQILASLAARGVTNYFMEFDGVRVLSRQSDAYPNPTLNHFALARYLSRGKVTAPKFLDLGCGVGFLGNYAGVRLETKELVFADLNPEAINQALFSYQVNHRLDLGSFPNEQHDFGLKIKAPKHTLDCRVGNAAESLDNFDAQDCIAVAAPMYLPGVCEVFPQAFMLFAHVAKKTGAKLYIGHSNLTSDLVEQAARQNGLHLRSKEEQSVPFMIEYTHPGKALMADEFMKRGLELREGRAYHKLMVSELSYK